MISVAVVDSSVAVKWVIEEQDSDKAATLMSTSMLAPDLILVECSNILWKKVRRGESTKRQAAGAFQTLLRAPIQLTAVREIVEAAHSLSLDLDHPSYDCLYLALAEREGVPLITADKRLVHIVRQHRKYAARVVLLGDL